MPLFALPDYSPLFLLGIGLVISLIARGVYRIYFSPLGKFPGPKLAALTLWYEFYYDVFPYSGQYTFKLREFHEKYGPIVRINPYELHINDATYYNTIYAAGGSGEKRDKWQWYSKIFGAPGSMFETPGHDLHRARREPLGRYFSLASVRRLQPVIQERVNKLIGRFRESINSGEVFKIHAAFAAFTNDVVMEYSFGCSDRRVDAPDFSPWFMEAVVAAQKSTPLMKHMIWIFHVIQMLPDSFGKRFMPKLMQLVDLQRSIRAQVVKAKAQEKPTHYNSGHPNIFHELLQSDLPEEEKTVDRITDEAFILTGAGTGTTAWCLGVATFHLLSNPQILTRLKKDLKAAIPDTNVDPPLPVLEQIPYLVAIVQEALRLSYGVSSRIERISPDKALTYTEPSGKTWSIPAGTPLAMTSVLIHHNEAIFPNNRSFVPERWIEDPRLDRYLVSFSKGSRACLGINLALSEIYICLAALFRRFGSEEVRDDGDEGYLELFETTLEDVEISEDLFLPFPSRSSQGIRIKIRR